MATLTLNDPFDMTDWGFTAIKNGAVAKSTTSQYFVTNAGATYEFTGTGLTYDASHHLTGGTVTGYKVVDGTGATDLSLTGFNLAATTLASAIANGDSTGLFEKTVFNAGDNIITGSAGDDVLTDGANTNLIAGGDGDDLILVTHQGTNVIQGGAGNDTVDFKAAFLVTSFDGGDGNDTVIIHSAAFAISLASSGSNTGIANVEDLILGGPGHYVVLDGADAAIPAGDTMTIDGSALAAGSNISMLSMSAETDANLNIIGGAGNDSLAGGDGTNIYHLEEGGNDHAMGGTGNDNFYFGATLTAADRINGGTAGNDVVYLNGDYSAGLTLSNETLVNINLIVLQGAHTYNLTLDQNIAGHTTTEVAGSDLPAANKMIVDASALTGQVQFIDSPGDDTLTGGSGNDTFFMLGGGTNKLASGAGNDTIEFLGGTFNAAQVIDGGNGVDNLEIAGDYSGGVTFGATTMKNIETLTLAIGSDYNLTLNNGNVAAGKTLTIDASSLQQNDQAIVDGSAEKDGRLVFLGGAGADVFTGGTAKDVFTGGGGADHLISAGKGDTFDYGNAADSTGPQFDTITNFNAGSDHIAIGPAITSIDATLGHGPLSLNTFDANLESAVDANHLGANSAMIFKPDSGTLKGDVFLVVDLNGIAGYQTGSDLVIQLDHAVGLAGLSASNFQLLIS